MNDDLDDYKLDTTWHEDPSQVVHTSFERDRCQRGRKVKIDTKWYRKWELGVGSCGVVYLETTEDGAERAVKCIRKSMAARLKIDYRRELAAISTFSKAKAVSRDSCDLSPYYSLRSLILTKAVKQYQQHQVFVEFLGWFENPEFIFVAMEYLPLGDLSKHVVEDIQEQDLKDISSQLLEGLRIMHSKGFTHRDLKPQNIFVVQITPSWWVKIGDFGIAKRVRDGDATELRTATGTQGYEAPEIRGYVEVDDQNPSSVYTNVVDIWSFGCVIYKIVAKQVPFKTGRDIKWFCDKRKSFPAEPLLGKLTIDGIDFLQSVLVPKPLARPTAELALNHPWLMPDEEDVKSNPESNTELVNRDELSAPLEGNTVNTAMQLHNDYEARMKSKLSRTFVMIDRQRRRSPTPPLRDQYRRENPTSATTLPPESIDSHGDLSLEQEIWFGSERLQNPERSEYREVQDGAFLYGLGVRSCRNKDWESAIALFTKAIQLDSREAAYFSDRAAAYICCKDYKKALDDVEAAIKVDRYLASAWYLLANMRYKQGYLAKSMDALHECVRCESYGGGKNAELYLRLASELQVKVKSEQDIESARHEVAQEFERTSRGRGIQQIVLAPTQVKVRIEYDRNYVTLMAEFKITYNSLVSRIDAKIGRFSNKSIARGEVQLEYRPEGDYVFEIQSTEDVHEAFEAWFDAEQPLYLAERLGEITLFCVTVTKIKGLPAPGVPSHNFLSRFRREQKSTESARENLRSTGSGTSEPS